MDRRHFLIKSFETLSSVSLGSILFPEIARAQNLAEAHFFVFVNAHGGMDTTLGLDPQLRPPDSDENDLFLEYRPEDIVSVHGLKLGPAANILSEVANDCAVINGVMMRRDAGHFASNVYVQTGRGDGRVATLPVELALATGIGPFGVVMTGQPLHLAGRTIVLSSTTDLKEESENGALLDLLEEKLQAFPPGTEFFGSTQKALVEARIPSQNLIAQLRALETKYGELNEKHVIAAALASGASRHAQWDLPTEPYLDTHSNHPGAHLRAQTKVWQDVVDLFRIFKALPFEGKSLFDATTFVVVSEFSRTPYLNASQGKDHNAFTNSVLFAGKRVLGGQTIGKSHCLTRKNSKTGFGEHYALPFNFKEKKPAYSSEGASFIFPENIVQTVAQLFGNPAGFSAVPSSTPPVPGVLKV